MFRTRYPERAHFHKRLEAKHGSMRCICLRVCICVQNIRPIGGSRVLGLCGWGDVWTSRGVSHFPRRKCLQFSKPSPKTSDLGSGSIGLNCLVLKTRSVSHVFSQNRKKKKRLELPKRKVQTYGAQDPGSKRLGYSEVFARVAFACFRPVRKSWVQVHLCTPQSSLGTA